MDQITDLRELLKHELKDLYSAETQIIDGLPKMIEAARNPQLKKALSDHLKVTKDQKTRLDEIEEVLNYKNEKKDDNGGFFANLFKSNEGEQHCKAMEGLIKEANSLLKEDMAPEVMDAAIIAAAQKIEHYEIGSYGTARAYAEQMGMREVERLLKLTLDEEYFADDSLTKIALDKVNVKAEVANGAAANAMNNSRRGSNGTQSSNGSSSGSQVKKAAPKKAAPKKTAPAKTAMQNTAPKKAAAKKAAPKKAAPKKAASKKTAPKKSAAKKGAVKKAAPNKGIAKKTAPKKAAPKKAMVKKAAPKKTAPKKAAPKKAAAKKAAPKKSAAKKGAVKKSAPKKAASKTAPKKTAPKKAMAKKSAAKKTAPKKSAAKKGGRRR
jgi:ferritin-like metal-binding protein YciE